MRDRGQSLCAAERVRIGVSACLLGARVRYDGGHKRDPFLVETFGPYVDWVPVCPEVELGLATPRAALRLEQDGQRDVRLVMPFTGADYTAAMRQYARARVAQLRDQELCGYILKKSSPSCGMDRVKVYGSKGPPARSGRGLFADELRQRFPNLPVEEEDRLNDPRRRENFVERVFAYQRVRALFARRWTIGQLVTFHSSHKLQLLAHTPTSYANLGRLVAQAKQLLRSDVRERYEAEFMAALSVPATRPRHANVLQHMAGYFRTVLDAESRRELLALIEEYRRGLVPLIVPLTLLRHYARRFAIGYLKGQVYLEPHPKELMLRHHA